MRLGYIFLSLKTKLRVIKKGETMKTVKEIATQLNVSIHTVRQWIKLGKLRAEQTVTGYVVE